MSSAEVFNRSGFSRFLNSLAGRIFRVVVGTGFLFRRLFYSGITHSEWLPWCSAFYP